MSYGLGLNLYKIICILLGFSTKACPEAFKQGDFADINLSAFYCLHGIHIKNGLAVYIGYCISCFSCQQQKYCSCACLMAGKKSRPTTFWTARLIPFSGRTLG